MNNILEVRNIEVDFNGHKILDDISFDIARDSTVAIIGANGSGKTVLFKVLLNLIDYKGSVKWQDDVRIGYVPQKLSVARDLPITVLEFLKLKEPDTKKIYDVLESVGFKERAEHIHHDRRVLETQLGSLSVGKCNEF
jgi:zinc transport system ATP-binding protein